MVSILDSGVLSIFSGIFVFLLVYAVTWGVLTWKKWFGDKPSVYAIIALMFALMMSVAPPARNFISFVAPWYIALFFIIFFMLFIVSLFGIGSDKFPDIIRESTTQTWLIILCAIIFLAGLAFTFGQEALNKGTGTNGQSQVTTGTGSVDVIGGGTPYYPPGTVVPTDTSGGYYGSYDGSYGATNGYPSAGQPGSTSTPDYQTNLLNTLIHPKVLGLLITMFIAAVAVYFLSKQN